MKNSRAYLSSILAAVAMIMIVFMQTAKAQPEPTGYCYAPPFDPAYVFNYPYYYCGCYTYCTNVAIVTNGITTMNWPCTYPNGLYPFNYTRTPYQKLSVGGKFTQGAPSVVQVTMSNGYYGSLTMYARVFLDINRDGVFQTTEQISYYNNVSQTGFYPNYTNTGVNNCNFTCPGTASAGLTRMRVDWEYYYYMLYYNPYDLCTGVYANGDPMNACKGHPWYTYPCGGMTNYQCFPYGGCFDFVVTIEGGVKDTYPTQNSVLLAGEMYNGVARNDQNGNWRTFDKPQIIFSSSQPAGTQCYLKIVGPSPAIDTVYWGTTPGTFNEPFDVGGMGAVVTMGGSKGAYAYPAAPQVGNGTFVANKGGEYKILAHIIGKPTPLAQSFTVAWPNDLATTSIETPKTNSAPYFNKYLQGNSITVSGYVKNTGMNDITNFYSYAIIYDASNRRIDSLPYVYDSPPQAVLRGGNSNSNDAILVNYGTFQTMTVGVYHVRMVCNVTSNPDNERYNDSIPRLGSPDWTFEVAYQYELSADKMIYPATGASVIGNRQFTPIGQFKNNGAVDVSLIPICLNIRKVGQTTPVYSDCGNTVLQDISQGTYNTARYSFKNCILRETGNYDCELIISHPDDPLHGNDTLHSSFSVKGGLTGYYTVGTTVEPGLNYPNFPSVDSAMNALYLYGLAGPVTFYMTDATYNLGSANSDQSLDMSTKILNVGYDQSKGIYNTITWAPSPRKSLTRASVTVNLLNRSGNGIRFGQNNMNTNSYAISNQYPSDKSYVNSDGYIIFDGGDQKSLKFISQSKANAHAAAFYLDRGSKNITIKNCLIDNTNPANNNNVTLPYVSWDLSNGFKFSADSTNLSGSWYGLSAGIESRCLIYVIPTGPNGGIAPPADTVPNSNNVFLNNEISNFGYGIVSIGLGPIYMSNEALYRRFYNTNNLISGNLIYNVAKAGIYAGFEENSTIKANRIYKVGNGVTDAAGIYLGGTPVYGSTIYPGYNNIGVKIDGNEISEVSSPTVVHGIRDEQSRRTYKNAQSQDVNFPNVPENTTIMNNSVWGLGGTATAQRFGIGVFTERNAIANTLTPNYVYFRNNDYLLNNTIRMSDNGQASNTGNTAALEVLQTKGAIIKNNAIAYDAQKLPSSGSNPDPSIAALVLYSGVRPSNGGATFDRNIYWAAKTSDVASAFRFVETDNNNNILEPGYRNEYFTLYRWQSWTGQDMSSIEGDFTQDLIYDNNYPSKLRVNLIPQPPLGSLLSNRGDKNSIVTTDIDGNSRQDAGQRPDVGASEFVGRNYVNDLEVLSINQPRAYQAGVGQFSDAEYIMAPAPINVTANLRNNGNLQLSDVKVYLDISRQNTDGSTYSVEKHVETTVSIPSGESVELSFNLASGDKLKDFYPKSYGDLRGQGYTLPTMFSTMEANVTPPYKIDISVASDQNLNNNKLQQAKIVRFYIPKSTIQMMISSENSYVTLTNASTQDQIAGSLNSDSVRLTLKKFGWFTDIAAARYDVDMFERNSWEPRSVNYVPYRTMFWSDGVAKGLNLRYMRSDLNTYLNSATAGNDKKNLIIASEEMLRENQAFDPTFCANVLRSTWVNYVYNLPSKTSYQGNFVAGIQVGANETLKIDASKFNNPPAADEVPYGSVLKILNSGDGLTRAGLYYKNYKKTDTGTDSLMGVATSSITKNILYFGLDWRHFTNVDQILRASLDYVIKNGGRVTPVELSDFTAVKAGKKVNLNWKTMSEDNTDKFIIERAIKSDNEILTFKNISEVKAAGKSNTTIEYGPVNDYDVNYGETYIYRLKMVDLDGQSEYSDKITVVFENPISGLTLTEAQPNPAVSTANFTLEVPQNTQCELVVYEMSGKQVEVISANSIHEGTNPLAINVQDYANGVYTLVLRSGNTVITRKFNVVK
ncbi:MAG: T9SS type A sorting domain-containing protein [Candidatus Kapabacteria bacterium]|nr:T9SS type A sorting domain-containing protein [Candidatus Kapabacteria bacterium]